VLPIEESPEFLSTQLITYIGNKRKLLGFIGQAILSIRQRLNKDRLSFFDGFSGSGVVARFFKQYASELHVNDLELYSQTLNQCYLSNASDVPEDELQAAIERLNSRRLLQQRAPGIVERLYAPADDNDIQDGERVFYTNQNARILDNLCQDIADYRPALRPLLLAPLLVKASIHANTSGVFKGFYKNSETRRGQFGGNGRHALSRILREIDLPLPIFSRFECPVHLYRRDTNALVKELPEVDVAYFDPPYNQHPYGSNYFMLNLLCKYEEPEQISTVSGIPKAWNKSDYNQKRKVANALEQLVRDTPARFLVLSYNNEGFVSRDEMEALLSREGKVEVVEQEYATFRGSRNLRNRSLKVREILFVLEKQ
jgi:adenine-specific DNA-methyltransferase